MAIIESQSQSQTKPRRSSPSTQHRQRRGRRRRPSAADKFSAENEAVINSRTRAGRSISRRGLYGWNYCVGGIVLSIAVTVLLNGPQSVSAGFACLSNPCVFGVCVDDLNRWVLQEKTVYSSAGAWWQRSFFQGMLISDLPHWSIDCQMKCNDIICSTEGGIDDVDVSNKALALSTPTRNGRRSKKDPSNCPTHCEFNEDTPYQTWRAFASPLITYLQSEGSLNHLLRHTHPFARLVRHSPVATVSHSMSFFIVCWTTRESLIKSNFINIK